MLLTLGYFLKINQEHSSQDEVTFVLTHNCPYLSDPKRGDTTGHTAPQDHTSIIKSPSKFQSWHLGAGPHTLEQYADSHQPLESMREWGAVSNSILQHTGRVDSGGQRKISGKEMEMLAIGNWRSMGRAPLSLLSDSISQEATQV
jgi:hypothetical protein